MRFRFQFSQDSVATLTR